MDNIEIIIYILISIGWFLLQSRRKKMQKKAIPRSNKPETEDFPTMEEQEEMLEPERTLLKELLGVPVEKNPKPEDMPVDQPAQEMFFPHEEDKEDFEKLTKKVKENQEKDQKRFEAYELKPKTAVVDAETDHPVKDWLFEDPDGPAKAVILSEILKRKEF